MLAGKHILLGVSGGIAAYKAAFLVRELVKTGAEVQVVMTRAATSFITPLTMSTLSKREVIVEMFPPSPDRTTHQWTQHIDLALWADVMLVAPASANTIAKLAHGLADNFLTTLVLALRCPLVVAPAMDVDMYVHEATRRNIDALKELGCFLIDPDTGELASGLSGPGRLPEVDRLVAYLDKVLDRAYRDFADRKVLVTAGPTVEPIDPVRFISNRSSGKMGYAIANAAALRGADVALVSGPVHLRAPRNTRRIDVETAEQMKKAVEQEFDSADLVVMTAAVADFAPLKPSTHKIKRDVQADDSMSLEFRKNPDILRSIGEKKTRQVLVGFALETDHEIENAQQKLNTKHLDAIVLNNPLEEGAGFGSDTNVVTVITADGRIERLPRMSKFDVANEILSRIAPLLK
jgi:phosphopantothenoylcysteine decarboxylase/phosphopantothenate--cysteine ligase